MPRDGRPLTPSGYKNSIKTRAKNAAATTPGVNAGELTDLYYHRRLLARVFHADPGRWVLKGGQALLVRWPAARYSTDIDLLGDQDSTDEAVAALIEAAGVELDDHILFRHQKTTDQPHPDRPTRTVYFRAMFGNVELRRDVKVDVVVSGHLPRGAVVVEPLDAPFNVECDVWPEVRMFPLEDHVAEKICAMYEKHRIAGNDSTRYKDLADLAIIALNSPFDGAMLHATLLEEVHRRRDRGMVLELPATFTVPNSAWRAGYSEIAKKVRELPSELNTFAGVQPLMDAFLTPLLKPTPPSGSWTPQTRRWG
ncbi:nucleotidyl transferase AbiEii/AbiGii toxin family protein [Amycolatopsis eburnea]|uniref:Nucleotidyl transferase AbiEii/AbiGii toxin family protein n=1 Tax=Amycolatopsis eburnea TaxID=2267691 RepID=A0A3R9E8L2_9PSEU|nr:nucleotidyl transferase AbiEii/AbiGii toxin family protein [Amycolatopsis eburnea]RSD26423.1 nucleotidyl transferase AbiEii/AbiGii toxin family protein [Amycolatopsis eburnea]